MKKVEFFICLSALLILSLQAVAQQRGGNNTGGRRESFDREEFLAKRNTYITEKVGLTAEETAVLIPLDNELLRKKFEVGRDCHQYGRELQNKTEKTDEEINKLLKCREEVKGKREQLDREYYEKFKKILSAEKLMKYQNADKEFMDEFIRNRR